MEPPLSIHLHVDRIILDGLPFTLGDAVPIRAALESEITRLFAEHFSALPSDSLTLDHLSAPQISFDPKPANFGRKIGAKVGALLPGPYVASFPKP